MDLIVSGIMSGGVLTELVPLPALQFLFLSLWERGARSHLMNSPRRWTRNQIWIQYFSGMVGPDSAFFSYGIGTST
jgi:hypothetical protein